MTYSGQDVNVFTQSLSETCLAANTVSASTWDHLVSSGYPAWMQDRDNTMLSALCEVSATGCHTYNDN